MGKHHNSKPAVQVEETEVTLPKVSEPEVAAEPVVEEPVVEVKPVTGVVVDCARLNVRRAPSTNATAVCTVDRNAEVIIDIEKSKNDWYSVCTEAGVSGFCMKKYIEISQ